MEILVRKNVDISQLHRVSLYAWSIAIGLGKDLEAKSIELTSGKRYRKHGEKFSFHHTIESQAIDLVVTFTSQKAYRMGEFHKRLKKVLGEDYDVLHHRDRDGSGKHTHIEHDKRV